MANVQHERFCTFSRRYSSPRRKWPSSSDDPHLEEKNFTIDRPWFSGPVKGKRPGLEHFSHGAASSRHVGSITKMLEVSEKPNVFPLHFNAVRMRRLNYFLHFFQSQKMNEWWEFSPFRGTHFSFRLSFFLEVTWRFVLRRFDADRKVNSISAMISAVTSR